MSIYALDTNIVSYFLRDNEVVMKAISNLMENRHSITIPPVVYYEVRRWLMSSNTAKKIKAFENLCGASIIDKIDIDTLEIAASIYVELKKKGRCVEDSDIFIAASCIKHNYTLVTNNVKHFENIDGIQFINWMNQRE